MILESIKTVLKVFKTNKMRTFLTMLGMIIGIFSITIIFSLSDSTKQVMSDSLSLVSEESIYLNYDAIDYIQNNLIETDLKEYFKKNNIKYSVSSSFYSFGLANSLENSNENEEYYLPEFLSVDENYFDKTEIDKSLIYGRILNKKDIINKMPYIIIREDIAQKIYGKSNVVGEILNIDNHELEIIGVYHYNESDYSEYGYIGMYISYYYAKDYMDTSNNIYNIYSTKETKEQLKKELKDIMNNYLKTEEYYIYSDDINEMMDGMNNMIDIVEIVFAGIAGLSIIVGGIGIMNIMLVSVSERIKETGIRMALGARNKDIIAQFLIEGIMITVLSGLIGIILASITTSLINVLITSSEYDFKLIINFMTMVKIILFCGIIGIIFGIYPAIKAGKLNPVEALKYE